MASRLLQRQIGAILHQLRLDLGWSRTHAAGVLGTTEAKLKRYEKGEINIVEPGLAVQWALWLHASKEVANQLRSMAIATRGDVTRWDIPVRPWFSTFVALEATATAIDIVEAEIITGLLQVPEYVKATVRASAVIPPERTSNVLELRQKRQEAVFERDGALPAMRVILNENALNRIKHEEFYSKQLARLEEVDALEKVEIYVLPTQKGLHASNSRSYMVLEFSNTPDPEAVYIDTAHDAYYESNRDVVALYRKMFTATLDDAVRFQRSNYE